MAEFENGVRVTSWRSDKTIYHTQKECCNYPGNPAEATESRIEYHDLTKCDICHRIETGEYVGGEYHTEHTEVDDKYKENAQSGWETKRNKILERHGYTVK